MTDLKEGELINEHTTLRPRGSRVTSTGATVGRRAAAEVHAELDGGSASSFVCAVHRDSQLDARTVSGEELGTG